MNIRKEESKDYKEVFNLIESAFEGEAYTDHKEHFLVERLRYADSFVPELSLVAENDAKIVGYILLTKIRIVNNDMQKIALALAPIAVLKEYRGMGIGGKLIQAAHQKARELRFGSVILVGHEHYYPKFGYKMAKNYGIEIPFEAPDENCMLLELTENALQGLRGLVEYPKEFYE